TRPCHVVDEDQNCFSALADPLRDSIVLLRDALVLFFLTLPRPPHSTLFPYTTLFRSARVRMRWTCAILASRCVLVLILSLFLGRSEEHTSELQSPYDLVCRLLLEKKKLIRIFASLHTRISIPLMHVLKLALTQPRSIL